jgi:hypothetical protein
MTAVLAVPFRTRPSFAMLFGKEISKKLEAYQLTAYGVFCTGFRAYRLSLRAATVIGITATLELACNWQALA